MKYLFLLLSLCLTACNQAESLPAYPEIESPLRNVCQSGDLSVGVPKCEIR